jgi:glycosyltransferase involved in cell wall biosynthesis
MIYNGVNALIPPPSLAPNHSGKYFLCVGSLQPHKNLARMIRAYLLFKKEFSDIELHVVGRPQSRFVEDPELSSLLSAPGVRLLGYLSKEKLAEAYVGALAFCYPSLEEGFGLPILEAMHLGIPILTSNVSCLPEVSGPSALLVDPFSVEDLAAALKQILTMSPNEREAKIESGRKWAVQFSWHASARAYLKLYLETLQ